MKHSTGKKLLFVLLVVALFAALTVFAGAVDTVDSGYCGGEGDGTNLTWTLDTDGLLTISGEGNMHDYTYLASPWKDYGESVKSVTVKNSVTSIGDYAFLFCSNLTSIEIPEGVTSIGVDAFCSCSTLASIEIPEGVTSIGEGAFASCSSLASIEIPDSVTYIGDFAFGYCSSLTSVKIPYGVKSIGNDAFEHCITMTNFEIPDGVRSIGKYAFSGCSNLTCIKIPDSVAYIGEGAFDLCESLKSFAVGAGNEYFSSDEYACLYNNDKTVLIQYPIGNTRNSFVIPDSVTRIGDRAFESCGSLTSVVIPDSVTRIGDFAFDDCRSLTSIMLPTSVTSIGWYAFEGCSSLMSAVIPENVTSIGDSAFNDCPEDLVIFGYVGSYAQTFAEENGIIFVPIDGAPYIKLHTQQTIDSPSFPAHGVANRYADVSVFEGETLLGTAVANASGHWEGNFTLADPADPSDHTITAKVTVNEETATATDTVRYDTNAIYPTEFTMEHSGTTIDLLNVRSRHLTVVPSKPMSFTVKLNRAVESLSITSTKGGEVKFMNATYDAATDTWTATGWFEPNNKNYVPGEIGIRVNGTEDLIFETARITYLIDPSGYVYEAVKSNRVEGATAFIYYQDDETPLLWNANQFEQDNPQITDALGVYHWDVTEGVWRLKVVKAGYEAAYSEWMTVPPEWTEVAIPLVSTAAPTVQSVEKDGGSYVITFSQYMELSSVNSKNVRFTVGENALAGTLTPMNSEVSGTDETVEYASVFVFTPNTAPQGQVDVSIEKTVNYVGRAMEDLFSTNFSGVEPHTDHTWNEGAVTTEPTCTTQGVKTFTCTVCGAARTAQIDALGHTSPNGKGDCERCGTHLKDMPNLNTCPYCGETHTGIFGWLVKLFHNLFFRLFGKK